MQLRHLLVAGCIISSPTVVLAQQAGGMDAGAAVRAGFAEVSGNVTKSAEMVPADKYGFRPTAQLTIGSSPFFSLATLVLREYAGVGRSWPPPVRGKD